jgi:hypothetical protein
MDNQNREVKEVKTSGGHTLMIKTYATGREYNEIQNQVLKNAKVSLIGGQPVAEGITGSSQLDANKKAIELLVVSVDGKTDGALDLVLDLPASDYQEVVDTLNELLGKKKE